MQYYKDFCYNSEKFFLLRSAGWLIGIPVGLLVGLFTHIIVTACVAIVVSIVSDFYLFIYKDFKETDYKNPDVLNRLMSGSQNFDKYARVVTFVKPMALGLVTFFSYLCTSKGEDALVDALVILASAVPVYAFFMHGFVSPKIALLCKVVKLSEIERSKMPANYGVPGFNSQGHYTNSSTGVGGSSS